MFFNFASAKRAFGGLNAGLKLRGLRYLFGGLLYLGALILGTAQIPAIVTTAAFLAAYIIFGFDILHKAVRGIIKGQVFNENFLMSIATMAAIYLGMYTEAVLVMVFFQVGEFFQDMAVNRSRESIKDLMDIKAEYANLIKDNDIIQVDPSEVKTGDIILVKPGEKIPLDGIILEGASQIDLSSLIGETIPRTLRAGEEVPSGGINLTSLLKIQTTKDYKNSTVAKILDLVENAAAKKSQTERFITKFAKIYTPIVILAALLLSTALILFFPDVTLEDSLLRGIIFLMISCPCALHLSVPLSFFSGIGASSSKGILFKGSTYLQVLTNVGIVVFDKTGTITHGAFKVTEITPTEGITKKHLLETAACIESFSNHPIAKSITAEADFKTDNFQADNFREISGKGLKAEINGKLVLAGNAKLMQENGIVFTEDTKNMGSVVYIAEDGQFLGRIIISDIIKEDSKEAVRALKAMGIKKTVMLSGDRKEVAEAVAEAVGIDEFYAELLPGCKVDKVEELYARYPGSKIAFVGDGINDTPVLTRADVGIAMGTMGTAAAVEAADVVLMTDELSKLPLAVTIAHKTMSIVKQNIFLVMAIKLAILTLAVFGRADIYAAVLADSGVALLAVLNSMRKK